jgi:PhnB protein
MRVEPYLFFDGRCEEAIEFYKKALGAQVAMMMRFKDNPEPQGQGRTAHRAIPTRSCTPACPCAAPTSWPPTDTPRAIPKFEGFSLSFPAKDEKEADQLFAALSDGGQVQMPLTKTFFSPRFGMVADKFGVSWMVMVNQAAPAANRRTSSSRACSMRRASWSGRPSPTPSA